MEYDIKGMIRRYPGNGSEPETIFDSETKVIGIATDEGYTQIKEMLSKYEETKEKYEFIPILQFYEDGNFSLALNVKLIQKGNKNDTSNPI